MPELCDSPPHAVPSSQSIQFRRAPSRFTKPARVWAASLAIVAAGTIAWHSGLKYRFVPKRFAVVVPGRIYRSGQISRRLIGGVLDRHGIRLIVDLNGEVPDDADQQAELQAARQRGIVVKRFPLGGSGLGDIRRYADALTQMHRAARDNRPVLVHCHAGSSRTSSAIAFYRLLVQNRAPDVVLAEMRRYDPEISPGHRLVIYMNSHMRTLAELLVQSGVISRVPENVPQLGR